MDSRDPYPTLRDDTTDELTNEDGPRLDPGNDDGSLSAVAFELAVLSVLLLLPTLCRVSIERGPPEVVFALRSLNFFTPVLCLLPICPSLFSAVVEGGYSFIKNRAETEKKKALDEKAQECENIPQKVLSFFSFVGTQEKRAPKSPAFERYRATFPISA